MNTLQSISEQPTILVTGGAGYIGSHTVLSLIEAGYQVSVVDNLENGNRAALERIETLTKTHIDFHEFDLKDAIKLDHLMSDLSPQAVLHFAGLKAVGESVEKPLHYYETNIGISINLIRAMQTHQVRQLVFSSSATVYGDGEPPFKEDAPLSTTNPYGTSKLVIEKMIEDVCKQDPNFNAVILRYFNPVGAHESGCIGEDPNGIPNNLVPYIAQVACGKHEWLNVFGNDYPTHDGTGVRDYIHVVDLAQGHIAALKALEQPQPQDAQPLIFNLGTGEGVSVLEMLNSFSEASGQSIPYEIMPRRSGDVALCYADVSLANGRLAWQAEKNLTAMCEDTWRWQHRNPNGF